MGGERVASAKVVEQRGGEEATGGAMSWLHGSYRLLGSASW